MINDFGWLFIKVLWITRILQITNYSYITIILLTILWLIVSSCLNIIADDMIIKFELFDPKEDDDSNNDKKDDN